MDARDVQPSRLEVAREKASKILAQTGEQQAGLVVFAGDGFEIAPLTTDAQSLIGLLPAFDTSVVPVQGSRPDLALERAQALLRRGAPSGGEIVLITDGAKGRRAVDVAARLRAKGVRVSVLAVGTAKGGRIPLAGGANLRGLDGEWVVAETPLDLLADVANAGGGRFAAATADDSDLAKLLLADPVSDASSGLVATGRHARMWQDRGPWLVLPLLAALALGFRRGWIFSLAIFSLSLPMASLEASQSARSASSNEASSGVARLGTERRMEWRWLAVEMYRAGRYRDAAALFGNGDRADDHYNRGNALALGGLLRAAVAAYREALVRDSEHEDAHYNLAVVRSLLEESDEGERPNRWTGEDFEPSGDGRSGTAAGTLGAAGAHDAGTQPDLGERNPLERARDGDPKQSRVERSRQRQDT
ncbi:MAG: VWA domain-containing protein, partial [Nitrospirota bacterium]|nr:VWA domain-containing protein [Nitrospirota bacterium]